MAKQTAPAADGQLNYVDVDFESIAAPASKGKSTKKKATKNEYNSQEAYAEIAIEN